MRPLTEKTLAVAARELAARDEMLARIHSTYGDPPLWRRATGFTTLVHIILEQQVSLKSAKSMLVRLQGVIEPFEPQRFLELGDAHLRSLGVTRQKSAYLIDLSTSIVNGQLSFTNLARMSDDEARLALTRIKGIGLWSADVYLLMAMRRADIWPAGDLALAVAMKELKGLAARPGPIELEQWAEQWRPLRAVAARMLWQYYLGKGVSRQAVR
ncbi:MAG: DNA-3-methyladenine glycosylase [Acidobacteriota bacterium]